MIKDLEIMNNIDILFDKKIILYGASHSGIRVKAMLKEAGIEVDSYADSDCRKSENLFEGKKVYSLIELQDLKKEEYIIIIASMYIDEINRELENNNIALSVYSWQMAEVALKFNRKNKRVSLNYRKKVDYLEDVYFDWLKENDMRRRWMFPCLSNSYLNPVLVYQSGKVGSRTIYDNLLEKNIPAVHLHLMDNHKEILSVYKKIMKDKKIKVISLVREPVAKRIAMFFEMLEMNLEINLDTNISFENIILQDLEKSISDGKGTQFSWFKNEFEEALGIDVYRYPFDKEKGYTVINSESADVLLMKTEKLSNLESVIADFLGIEEFSMKNCNVGDKKAYKYLYNEIKAELKIPKHIFDFYYEGNIYMDHFYTEQEKQGFYEKWEKNNII